ncbi:MAG: zinc ribbon domain-containing protein [Planctomycetes bacterium]|nr:zinc ribbon domain-containing protein [Planctomycetota bacterium]
MPMFEFTCAECEHEFEELVRSRGSDLKIACPKCASKKVDRKFSVFSARANSTAPAMPSGSGCGRCGDPNGPCGM